MFATRLAVAAALFLTTGTAAQNADVPVREIILSSYQYSPNLIQLSAGQPVTLRLVNRAGKGHDFTAHRFFELSRIQSGPVKHGEVDLAPGETAEVTLVPSAGRYPIHCGHFLHKQMGMSGMIVVQ